MRKMQIFRIILQYHTSEADNNKQHNAHQVSEAVFPAFDVCKHIVLQAGDGAEFALVVWWGRFTGAAVLPHILKTYRCVMVIGYSFPHRKGRK